LSAGSPQYLFVYGTLRANADTEEARFLASHAQSVSGGRVQGRLYRIAHYPGMVLSAEADDWVLGEVFEVLAPEIFVELDKYEGCGPDDPQPHEYRRGPVPVWLDGDTCIEAFTYLYEWSVEGCARIWSGDFLKGA
jgi:gamma-glutamylcyclotransferase (GGCT)/AIG2-like uncharacterized protein YtfP